MARNYERIWSPFEATMLKDADEATTECNLWEWLKTFETDGFLFASHPNLDLILAKMKHRGHHSGASFAWCMRNMEAIAKKGWDAYVSDVLMHRIVKSFGESSDPEKQQQAETMKKFMNGELSYAEMRTLCG